LFYLYTIDYQGFFLTLFCLSPSTLVKGLTLSGYFYVLLRRSTRTFSKGVKQSRAEILHFINGGFAKRLNTTKTANSCAKRKSLLKKVPDYRLVLILLSK